MRAWFDINIGFNTDKPEPDKKEQKPSAIGFTVEQEYKEDEDGQV